MRSSGERRAANDERRVSFPDFPVKPKSEYFVSCPKPGLELEAVVLHRVGVLEYFCPKHGQDFKPSVAPLYPNMGQVHPPPLPSSAPTCSSCMYTAFSQAFTFN